MTELESKMCTDSCSLHEKIEHLLLAIFKRMQPGVWLRILPMEGKNDDIATTTNIDEDKG